MAGRSELAIIQGLTRGVSRHAGTIRERKLAERMAELKREGTTHYLTEAERVGRTGYEPGGTRRLGMELGLEEEMGRVAPGGPAEAGMGLKRRFAREGYEGMPGYQAEGMGESWMGALAPQEAGLYGREQALERGILAGEMGTKKRFRGGRGGAGKPKPTKYAGTEIDDLRMMRDKLLARYTIKGEHHALSAEDQRDVDEYDARIKMLMTTTSPYRTEPERAKAADTYLNIGEEAALEYEAGRIPPAPGPAEPSLWERGKAGIGDWLRPLPPIGTPESDEDKLRKKGYTEEQIRRYR